MSKRHKKAKLFASSSDGFDDFGLSPVFDGDMYEAPRGKKPRGKDKRKQTSHKTAYYD